jgi:hypothetical protein
MAVPRPIVTLLLLSLALAPACSHPPRPVTAAKPATPPPGTPQEAAAPATPAPGDGNPKPEPARGSKVIVVDSGDDAAAHPKTLVEAAHEERERRAHAREPVAVITNKSLPHSKGQLTYAQPTTKAAAAKGEKGKEKAAGETRDEAYWRKRGLDIRQRWHDAADQISKLEQEVADWRRRFYSQDDPAVRDAQVKPEWDRALDQLQHKKEEVVSTRHELDAYLDEGRQAGALPGWLREGADLEPAQPKPPAASTEAIEPPQFTERPVIERPPS